MSHVRSTLLALPVLAALFTAARARAQEEGWDWRQKRHSPNESPQHAALELRFGPYVPDIDKAFSSRRPYEEVFGTDKRLYFGLELDWQALRIPSVGTIGPGIGWGYTHMTAPARLASGAGNSAEDTYLGIMPWYGVGVLRVDVLARETSVPLVGYGKVGVGFGLYWTGNDLESQAKGHTWGMQYALGGMLLLDNFDKQAAQQLDNELGINNTYLFLEWMKADLSGFGGSKMDSLRVGTSTWVLGLAVEM
jgi:hypothetical protein